MHESSLAKRLLEAALERAPGGRIVAVRGWICDAEALSAESLALHFAAHARGTRAEGARVEIAVEQAVVRCADCGHSYTQERHVAICPRCGGAQAQAQGRIGVGIDTIDVDGEEH